MSYYAERELRLHSGGLTASRAEFQIKEEARSAHGTYDVFLSHSFLDADVILGLKNVLEAQRLRVYVDWIDDPELDRTKVSATTAGRIQQRMRSCNSLVYATSRSARKSRWMPWELGYFEGVKSGDRISICPIEPDTRPAVSFVGEEYLGLYKTMQPVRWHDGTRPSAIRPGRMDAQTAVQFARGTGGYVRLSS